MFHKANLISICLSFYPFKKRMSIIRYSKKLQKVQGININYYQLLFSFFNSEQDYDVKLLIILIATCYFVTFCFNEISSYVFCELDFLFLFLIELSPYLFIYL